MDDGNELGRTILWGKSSIRRGSEDIRRKISYEVYCSTVKDKLSKIANSSKNLLLGLIFNL